MRDEMLLIARGKWKVGNIAKVVYKLDYQIIIL